MLFLNFSQCEMKNGKCKHLLKNICSSVITIVCFLKTTNTVEMPARTQRKFLKGRGAQIYNSAHSRQITFVKNKLAYHSSSYLSSSYLLYSSSYLLYSSSYLLYSSSYLLYNSSYLLYSSSYLLYSSSYLSPTRYCR